LKKWILESSNIALNFVYPKIEYKGKVTEAYKTQAFTYCRQRIAQGGFRLGKLVEDIYHSHKKSKKKNLNFRAKIQIQIFPQNFLFSRAAVLNFCIL